MYLEKKLVEDWAIEKLKEHGWNYIEPQNLPRESIEEPLLVENLKRKILEINKDVEITEEDLKVVVNKLKFAHTDQNGHKEILKFFKYGVPIKTEKDKIVKYVQLFDFKNIHNNEFVFSNQVQFWGRDKIRVDLLLFVNGIPLVNIECKNPYTAKSDYYSAYKQIKRYEQTVPELYKYVQIGIGLAEKVKYFPIVPWLEDVKQEVWRSEFKSDDEAIFEMLSPNLLLDILKNFLFVREFRGEMTKVIGRYMQYRAVNKIYQRVMDNLAGKTDKNRGLIWHWQGSGKTLTMIFAAHKLYFELGKPTIFFIVDRRELERQFSDELSALDLNFSFEKIESISALKDVLTHDNNRGKRGAFLTLIHKFNLKEEFLLDQIGEVNQRKDIICFLDEVHRTQYGILAGKLRTILANAFFFGFTGTPIALKDRNTYKEFGFLRDDDPELYLDRYFIDEAERDGFVVPIVYELRKEEVNLKEQDLDWYLKRVDVDDIAEESELRDLETAVRKRINEITVFLENPKNIRQICEDIAQHYKEHFDGKFKGLIVTGSRKACVRFKRILDEYLDPKYSEVVMTFGGEDEEIKEFVRVQTERFGTSDDVEIANQITEKFKKEEYPKLLIVTDMLITGFDEPKLAVLYLYKILKNHRLLQTIARVNRPHEEKAAGLLVDYVGIFKYIEEALSAYAVEDKNIIRQKLIDTDAAWEQFLSIFKRLEGMFEGLVGDFSRENFDRAIEILRTGEEEFSSLYRELRRRFEFLSTDGRMVNFLDGYKWFSFLYEFYKKLLRPDINEGNLEKYFNRTISLIHDLIEPSGLRREKPAVIDFETIKALKSSNLAETQKYVGILNNLKYMVVIKSRNPIYKSIAERVKELVERWQAGVDISQLRKDIDGVLKFIEDKERERGESKLSDVEFGMKLVLENEGVVESNEAEELARQIYARVRGRLYPGWDQNPAVSKNVERDLRMYLAELRPKYKIPYEGFEKLYNRIFEVLTYYGRGN